MDVTKRIIVFLTFFICCGCIIFLAVSLATKEWIVAKPVRIVVNLTDEDEGKFRGYINFGLFEGSKELNHGFGNRKTHISIRQEISQNPSFMSNGLWLFTIICVSLATLFALISAVFAIINTVLIPVEIIMGVMGLYLWNSIGALFSLAAVISWTIQYFTKLKDNVMTIEEQDKNWTSKDKAWLGYSFWFVVIVIIFFLLNISLVTLALQQPWDRRKSKPVSEKNPEGVIMLY